MLQNARSAESRSFLRELEFSLVLIGNPKARNYFLKSLGQVNAKRSGSSDSAGSTSGSSNKQTGEKDTKSEILAYLRQKGYVQTANIWARALSIDKEDINELLKILQIRLLQEEIEGILEVHLQDREINSPHIQFVGMNAPKAEVIIAQTLVELKYETSIESALSKKDFRPYYKINPKARYPKHNDLESEIKYRKSIQIKKSEEEIEKLINTFDKKLSQLKQTLEKTKKIALKPSTFEAKLQEIRTNNTKSLTKLREQRIRYRIRRLRRRGR